MTAIDIPISVVCMLTALCIAFVVWGGVFRDGLAKLRRSGKTLNDEQKKTVKQCWATNILIYEVPVVCTIVNQIYRFDGDGWAIPSFQLGAGVTYIVLNTLTVRDYLKEISQADDGRND